MVSTDQEEGRNRARGGKMLLAQVDQRWVKLATEGKGVTLEPYR